jgi:hypothetical protein
MNSSAISQRHHGSRTVACRVRRVPSSRSQRLHSRPTPANVGYRHAKTRPAAAVTDVRQKLSGRTVRRDLEFAAVGIRMAELMSPLDHRKAEREQGWSASAGRGVDRRRCPLLPERSSLSGRVVRPNRPVSVLTAMTRWVWPVALTGRWCSGHAGRREDPRRDVATSRCRTHRRRLASSAVVCASTCDGLRRTDAIRRDRAETTITAAPVEESGASAPAGTRRTGRAGAVGRQAGTTGGALTCSKTAVRSLPHAAAPKQDPPLGRAGRTPGPGT